MSYIVSFMPKANEDMDDIETYLSQFYKDTVKSFFENMKKHVLLLQTFPYMCPEYNEDSYFKQMVINDYLLFYSIDEKRKRIIIHRILHSKRDIHHDISSK